MLLNASHPRERRTQTAGRETGHFISARRNAEILLRQEKETTREERYANAYGRAFLTAARGVVQKFHEVTAGSDRSTRRHVMILAHFFGVSREAMVRRLEEFGPDQGWDEGPVPNSWKNHGRAGTTGPGRFGTGRQRNEGSQSSDDVVAV